MKVLLINQAFHPDPAASGQLLTDLALALVGDGADVSVLTSGRGYVRDAAHPRKEDYHCVKIRRIAGFSFRSRNKLSKILDALLMNVGFAWHLLWLPRFDKIVCLTSPPLIAWVALMLARRPRKGFIYWVMDINPDQAVEAGWLRRDALLTQVLEWTLRTVLSRSDKVIVLDRFMKERLVKKGAAPEKIIISHLWSDAENVKPVEHRDNPFRSQHDWADRFVVMYAGNMSICHPLDTLLEAAESFRDDEETLFVFLGGGARLPEVVQFREQRGLANIVHLPYEERSHLSNALSAGDLHVVSMGEPYVGIVHPSKIYGIMAVGRPSVLIGPETTFIGEEVVETGLGQRVDHGDVLGLVSLISEAKQSTLEEKNGHRDKTLQFTNRFNKADMAEGLVSLVLE